MKLTIDVIIPNDDRWAECVEPRDELAAALGSFLSRVSTEVFSYFEEYCEIEWRYDPDISRTPSRPRRSSDASAQAQRHAGG